MHRDPDVNWWDFTLKEEAKSDPLRALFQGTRAVNADGPLSYADYINVDALLSTQWPASRIPDERAFILTHQLMELAFRLMIFDLGVVERTFQSVLEILDPHRPSLGELPEDTDSFWRASLTASNRVLYASQFLLPAVVTLLDANCFCGAEFFYFRERLAPASGFQTAQFRLIQRAFGKSNLLEASIFPVHAFATHYSDDRRGSEAPLVSLVSPLVLQGGCEIANPSELSPYYRVSRLEDTVNELLSRFAVLNEKRRFASVSRISDATTEGLFKAYEKSLKRSEANGACASELRNERTLVESFRESIAAAVRAENARRDGMGNAASGAEGLLEAKLGEPQDPRGRNLLILLRRLRDADTALHDHRAPRERGAGASGKQTSERPFASDASVRRRKEHARQPDAEIGRVPGGSFLHRHLAVAKAAIDDSNEAAKAYGRDPLVGTAGGGLEYLRLSLRHLLPAFRAVEAFRAAEERSRESYGN